ncbi:methyl-accepting chemotaxis protein [Desulfovibrio psychrotolerans]|uniref:methyl-accepting chemotaxis protein n=1 Tax=Desulfovibrio psychrotolerans TaxID=415242 RepID=UPI00157A25E0|nr:methyl-accepting chemotaxis protein [Desulfovibrio psychrotolerans]
MKNVSIKTKLIGGFVSLLLLVCSGVGYIAYDRAFQSSLEQVQENIPSIAVDGAKLVRSRLDYYMLALEGVANRHVIRSMDWGQQQPALVAENSRLGMQQMAFVTPDGHAKLHDGTEANVSEREYFKQAMNGKTTFSDVIIHKVLNKPIMVVASPVKDENGKVAGVVFGILDAVMLSEVTDGIRYGRSGYSYIIDGKGALIAHANRQFVLDQRNFIEESRTNNDFKRLAVMLQRMVRGESGFDEYSFMGSDRFFGFSPIEGTAWSIAVGAIKDDVLAQVYQLRWTIALASAVFLAFGIGAGYFISRGIIRPIQLLMQYAGEIEGGNLQAKSGIDQGDELGRLNRSIQAMVGKLIEKMNEADQKTTEAAAEARRAQLATEEANEAKNRAERAKAEGMMQAAAQLEGVVEIISTASEELSAQIEQSSRGTEVQSQRLGETATAMEQMNATVLEVARNASEASEATGVARSKAAEGATVVSQAVQSITEVQQASVVMKNDMGTLGKQAEGIGQIMNVISDIADQTNLLALNAAIEAARAGDAGRGFAVVADEVRKLAEKTMTATKEVGQAVGDIQQGTRKNLDNVENSVSAIGRATELAEKSGLALQEIVTLVDRAADQVRGIATASEQQSSASEQINRSVEEIDQISQETASAMNQSAQAISELAEQAIRLRRLIEDMKKG